ncbi:endoplasmic reticulum aminopeptidase 1-like isoform X1 [Lineus longissimus]|uniref:endoplasmic reticulum aminopeptidase 1-like isoform X1 n=1 Tax=Lineus longissimus TaxID=88925 RepID=UPI00315D9082
MSRLNGRTEKTKLKEDFNAPMGGNGPPEQFEEGEGQTTKRSQYEPQPIERCKQVVCSQGRAILIATTIAVVIIAIALIAALARPPSPPCLPSVQDTTNPAAISSETTAAPPPVTTEKPHEIPYDNIRLPKSVNPLSYKLLMHPNITNLNFTGRNEITAKVVEKTDFIVIHSKKLEITRRTIVTIDGTSPKDVQILKSVPCLEHEQYYMKLSRALEVGEIIHITLEFNANLSDSMAGFYKSSYKTKAGEKRYLATTHFEPTDARAAFPCFDEPAMKANFTMSIIRSPHYTALFNMPIQKTENYQDGLLIDHFDTTVKMSTYLIAFVVCDFKHITNHTKNNNITVSVYAPPELIDQAHFALAAATKILDYYEHFFGVKYPLPKQDLIAIPDFAAGAMENWGLITYRMTAILFDPAVSSSHDEQWIAMVVAHELAHQWFGNLVTMKWWNDLWLNEGFASFVQYIGTDVFKPKWKVFDEFVTDTLQPALNLDSLSNSHPISVPVKNPSQINEIFDAISYKKGSSLIGMAQDFLTPEVLQDGLKHYLDKYKYGNAENKDLWDALSKASKTKVNVSEVMNTWTKQMGYPIVTLTRDEQVLKASQQRFLLNPSLAPSTEFSSDYGYTWHIPLTYITDSMSTKDQIWMHRGPGAIGLPKAWKWYKANVNQSGFYRVNYPQENWNALIKQLKEDHNKLSASDRAGLVDDAFALARAGNITQVTALELTKYLENEEEYTPWRAAIAVLDYIKKVLEGSEGFEYYTKYLQNLMKKQIRVLGWEDKGSHLQKYLRSLLLYSAVRTGDTDIAQKGRELFRQWMENGTKISPNLRSTVYRAGVQYGGEKEWNYCYHIFNTTVIPVEKSQMRQALSMTRDATLLNRLLRMSLEPDKIKPQDTTGVIMSIAHHSAAGRILAWDFIKQHWEKITKKYGESDVTRLILQVGGHFTTEYRYEEVKSFLECKKKICKGARATKQALESIKTSIKWRETYEESVTKWLKENTQ